MSGKTCRVGGQGVRCGVQGGASDFVLCFGVCVGRCFVFWIVFGISAWDLGGALCFAGFEEVEILGGLRNGVKA